MVELPDYLTFEGWKYWRGRCRTDLMFLCNDVLGYPDVQPHVHRRLLSNVQWFEGGEDTCQLPPAPRALKVGQFAFPPFEAIIKGYKPKCSMWDLEGSRRFLNMIPRGHLKSTIITQAHAIQWIINYPNVRIALSTHTDAKGKEFLSEIRNHFIKNAMFRYLFPEHCPMGKAIGTWGNQEHFDTLARTVWRREHTMSYITIGSAIAGAHFDVLLHDDLVDKENVVTKEQIERVKKHFADTFPLLETHAHPTRGNMDGWVYLTGTFYDFSDLNYSIYEHEKAKLSETDRAKIAADPTQEEVFKKAGKVMSPRIWRLNVQSAAPNWPEGPYLWPERVGYKKLKEIEDDPAQGPALLAAQYLMNPIPPNSGLIDSKDEIVWTPRRVLSDMYARMELFAAVDLAGMDENAKGADNDYTVITVGGFGTDGHLYIYEIFHGRPRPEEVINELFSLMDRHPRLRQIKIEKEAHGRVLAPFLMKEENRRKRWIPFLMVPRDNQKSKKLKIKGLQPWFKRGFIHFAEDLPARMWVVNEIMRFPKYAHDDILDTVYDLFMDKDGRVTNAVIASEKTYPEKSAWEKLPDGTFICHGNPAEATDEAMYGVTPDDYSGVDGFSGM